MAMLHFAQPQEAGVSSFIVACSVWMISSFLKTPPDLHSVKAINTEVKTLHAFEICTF